jgi:ketosteroid isomerase-like protein
VQTEATRASVQQIYDAYSKGDVERFAAFLDDNMDWVLHAPVEIFSFAGQRKGRAAVLEALAGIANEYELTSYEPQIMIADGEQAAVMSDVRFRQRKSGRMLRFRIADFLRFRNGKLVEFREFIDTFDVTQQALGRFIDV